MNQIMELLVSFNEEIKKLTEEVDTLTERNNSQDTITVSLNEKLDTLTKTINSQETIILNLNKKVYNQNRMIISLMEKITTQDKEIERLTSEVYKADKRKKIEERIPRQAEGKHIREVIILYHTEDLMKNDFMKAIIEEIKVDQANQDDEEYRNILEGVNIQSKIFYPKSSDNLPIYDPSQHSGVVYIYVPNAAGLERVDKIPGLEETSNTANRERFKEWQNQLFLLIPTGKVSLEKDWRSVLKTSTHSGYGVFNLKNIGHILYLKNKERADLYKGVFDPDTTLLIGKDSLSQTDEQTINVNIGTKQRLTELLKRNAVSLAVSEVSSTSSVSV